MNQIFQDWSIKRVEQQLKDPADKQRVLRKLKFEPDWVKDFFAQACCSWGMSCAVETNEIIHQDFEHDPSEFVEALRKHFAKELAEIAR